jgi:Gluconate 2-dehydrogenase subunit 3
MDRRTTIKWMLAASASMPFLQQRAAGVEATMVTPQARGYGTDPDLTKVYHAGDLWPLILTPAQRRTASALCDVIIPSDSVSRSASAAGVVDFLAEWVSAPYPIQVKDRALILDGLVWMNFEAMRRFGRDFAALKLTQQHLICDDICCEQNAKPAFAQAAQFFARYRDLTAGGYYSSAAGRKDLQYIGNVSLKSFDGPPLALLQKLGLGPEQVQAIEG